MGNDRFIELVSKHLTNEITPAENAELKCLITQFPNYKKQFDDLAMYWDHTETEYTDDAIAFQKIQDKIKKLENSEESAPNNNAINTQFAYPAKRKSILRFWPAAAILLIAAGAYLINTYVFSANNAQGISTAGWQQKTTLKGAKSVITLADGSHVTLNSQSTLKYPVNFSGDTREVILTGEAYFDVEKDANHPFIIHTEKINVKVLGTTFNVKSYPRDTVSETTLINGAIEVTLKDRPSDRIILKPKEKLIVKNNDPNNIKRPTIDTGSGNNTPGAQYVLTSLSYIGGKDSSVSETAWIDNRYAFEDDSFAELAEKMERWYGVDIQFKNNVARQYHFSGVFENDTIIQALDGLREIEKFNYKVSGSTIYIY